MSSHNTLIYDFDGVIADSFDVFVESLQEAMGVEPFCQERIEELRGMRTREVIKSLGIKPLQLPGILLTGRQKVAEKVDEITVFSGIPDAVRTLEGSFSQHIVSSNDETSIRKILRGAGIEECFDSIDSGVGITGKARRIKNVIKRLGVMPSDCYLIGDETRDIEAAHKTGTLSIAATWGYSLRDALEAEEPTVLIDTPAELVSFLKDTNKH